MKLLLAGAVAIMLAFTAAPVLTAEGTPGAAPGKDMAAGKEKFEQWCKANPEKCKAERQAKREEWCKANPEKDRKSTRLNSSHSQISYAVFCLKKKKKKK